MNNKIKEIIRNVGKSLALFGCIALIMISFWFIVLTSFPWWWKVVVGVIGAIGVIVLANVSEDTSNKGARKQKTS